MKSSSRYKVEGTFHELKGKTSKIAGKLAILLLITSALSGCLLIPVDDGMRGSSHRNERGGEHDGNRNGNHEHH